MAELSVYVMKQSFFTKELQAGDTGRLGQFFVVKERIKDWYEDESRKVIMQSRVDDVQQSEEVRIYHHEQHRKSIMKTAILKLQTESVLLVGHEHCSAYLESKLANRLTPTC